jgi:membrane-associated phospholipid phosphatase
VLRVSVACVLGAVLVWAGAFHVGVVHDADALVLRAAVAAREAIPGLDLLTSTLLGLIDPFVYPLVCVAIVVAGARLGSADRAFAAAVMLAGANVTTQILKRLLAEPRYHESLVPLQIHPVSWPSGHATAAATAVLAALLVAPPHRRVLVALIGGPLALGVAFAVFARHWHYPSDALGALLVAGAWASAAAAWVSSRRPARAATAAPRRRWLRATG